MASSDHTNGHATDRQSDLAVMDANEYKQKRRLERILDALDNVQDTADEAWNAYVTGAITREARNITIQRAVKKAIRECYKLLLDHHRTVESDPERDGPDGYWQMDAPDHLGSVDLADEQVALIKGLEDFLEAPTFFETTVTEEVERRNMPDKIETRTIETTMPEEISYRAFLKLKEFLDDVHDMEISFEELEDRLADEKPNKVQLPKDMDLSKVDGLDSFNGPVDARAVSSDDD